MKKMLFILSIAALITMNLFAATSTVTYSTRTQLGDGLLYTFTWTATAATDTAYVMGMDGDGFLITNTNDKQITVELSSTEATADSVDWQIRVLGNYEASSTVANYYTINTDSLKAATVNQKTYAYTTIGNNPYLAFSLRGLVSTGANNAAGQTITFRVFLDYDDKNIGKE